MPTNNEIAQALGLNIIPENILNVPGYRLDDIAGLDFSTPEWQEKIRDRVEKLCAEQRLFIKELKHPSGARLLELYEAVKLDGLWQMTDKCVWFIGNVPRHDMITEALVWAAKKEADGENSPD